MGLEYDIVYFNLDGTKDEYMSLLSKENRIDMLMQRISCNMVMFVDNRDTVDGLEKNPNLILQAITEEDIHRAQTTGSSDSPTIIALVDDGGINMKNKRNAYEVTGQCDCIVL